MKRINGKDKWEVLIKTSPLKYSEEPILSDDPAEDDADDAKERAEWLKIKDGIYGYEFSAIRKSNEHGHRSWGWGDANTKIILFSAEGNCLATDKNEIVPEKVLDWAKNVTQKFCDVLNSSTTENAVRRAMTK